MLGLLLLAKEVFELDLILVVETHARLVQHGLRRMAQVQLVQFVVEGRPLKGF